MIIDILLFVVVLSFLVIIHELGHYLVARLFGVHVEEFGIGYPPRAAKLFSIGSTLFSLNWIPFGGFVKLEGEEGKKIDELPAEKIIKEKTGEEPFYEKTIPQKMAIILAGASVNFIFGILAFAIYFSVVGIPVDLSNPRISEIAPGSPAEQAKVPVQVDVRGIKINGQLTQTSTTKDVIELVSKHLGEKVMLVTSGPCKDDVCEKTTQEFSVYLRKKEETPADQGSLGIRFEPVVGHTFYPWPEMPIRGALFGVQQAFLLVSFIFIGLAQIVQTAVHGQIPSQVAGPVGIFNQARQAGFFSHGFIELLNFAGLLSVNLAIMNILPIPALDGGRALFLFLELIIGRRHVEKFEGYANYGGLALLLFLITIITIKDIGSLFIH